MVSPGRGSPWGVAPPGAWRPLRRGPPGTRPPLGQAKLSSPDPRASPTAPTARLPRAASCWATAVQPASSSSTELELPEDSTGPPQRAGRVAIRGTARCLRGHPWRRQRWAGKEGGGGGAAARGKAYCLCDIPWRKRRPVGGEEDVAVGPGSSPARPARAMPSACCASPGGGLEQVGEAAQQTPQWTASRTTTSGRRTTTVPEWVSGHHLSTEPQRAHAPRTTTLQPTLTASS